ncbi:hypothetical protein C0989_007710 [Termitomyces sp. Mn162]|nr:hypothetical protein C0989_007710 [Termitomyces sp. Mn162]
MAEQGWDQEWVVVQLEEGWRGRVLGWGSGVEKGGSMGQPTMKVGPPWGGQREGAPAACNKGKQRVSPLPEAGPSKRAQEEQLMVGLLGLTVYSPTSGALVEQPMGGSWLATEAFLQHWMEGLEWLLAICKEAQRIGEERDRVQREWDEARKERDVVWRDKDIAVGTAME